MKFIGLILLLVIFAIVYKYLQRRKIAAYEGEYVEDFPYEHPAIAYAYLKSYRFSRLEDLISYFLLKWINEGRIYSETVEGGLFKSKERTQFRFAKNYNRGLHRYESKFLGYFVNASRRGVLNRRELYKWLQTNVNYILRWEEEFERRSLLKLSKDGIAVGNINTALRLLKIPFGKTNFIGTEGEQGLDLEGNIYRFKNYIKEFYSLHNRETVNITRCDDLLVCAALINMTNEAHEQFIQLDAQYNSKSKFPEEVLSEVNTMASHVKRAVRKRKREKSKENSRR